MRWTNGWRTTSRAENRVTLMPSISCSSRTAWRRPDFLATGRSIWVMSPVTTAVDPKPIRVRNIFICSTVVFWASSRMMKASLSVRPRM